VVRDAARRVGALTRDGGVAFTTVCPLAFLSNVFVPAGGLSAGLRRIAEYNPFSAVAAPPAIRRYRLRNRSS
jgi:hypothetical protein